ncbi:hypothetical protein HZS55_12640 [Halosimplex rubrum]|uniref:Uncharacterized protein n=1 Tax=Halosimplex rubrum TaxID=869889 RepID=A0A7D5P5R3_9EURY|nr:hypothetical protein [Halosimplex rubrum]QLH78098.1 hypothetical protein HZS55_12640 [Halosimplex rubrum]
MHEKAENQPRDPQTGQFRSENQGGQQGQQRRQGQSGGQIYAQRSEQTQQPEIGTQQENWQ